ncbi:MAG: LPS-assembly protein LptD [Oligoflexales bacterium]|nr:LPS-assembly protein LptD [Oligoflexales bacterium]
MLKILWSAIGVLIGLVSEMALSQQEDIKTTVEKPDMGGKSAQSEPSNKPDIDKPLKTEKETSADKGTTQPTPQDDKAGDPPPPDLEGYEPIGPEMFYDARTIGMTKKFDKSLFEGDVVAIGFGSMITADKIEVDKKSETMIATGHIVLLTSTQVFTGTRLEYHWITGDMKIDDVLLVAFDGDKVQKVSNELLGFTQEELKFEAGRKKRLDHLAGRKNNMRDEFRKSAKPGDKPSPELVEDYALALEQEELAATQENPASLNIDKERRSSFLKRREYWEKSRGISGIPTKPFGRTSYFRMNGDIMERTSGNDYRAYNAVWSPCKCEDDETPAWGFRANQIDAQVGGYVDMQHPILEIKGVPVLYLPYLKLPIKSVRQSGFLVPTLSTGNRVSGTVFTQPVFFDFADNFDSTVTTDIFEKRGTRLGLELRHEIREYSGWSLRMETIRDKYWNDQRNTRLRILEYHLDPSHRYCVVKEGKVTPEEIAQCEEGIKAGLATPSNTWRGMQEWRGQAIVAPRLSLVSHGTVRSDHRYVEDLAVTDKFEEAFAPTSFGNVFSTAKAAVHLDAKEFYIGTHSRFADYVFMNERFQGLQMPGTVYFQSRIYNLDPFRILPVPVYGEFSGDHIPITDMKNQSTAKDQGSGYYLRDGLWQRGRFKLVSPLLSRSIITVDHFTELEARNIQHRGLETEKSSINSWRSAVNFNLPIDGKGPLPMFLQPDNWEEEGVGKTYVHHITNWSVGLSTRPVVARRGAYEEPKKYRGVPQVYFASDRDSFDSNDDAAGYEDSMIKHERISFSTSQRWRTYSRAWELKRGAEKDKSDDSAKETYRQRALRELTYSMDLPVSSHKDMFDPNNESNWYINRYLLKTDKEQEPVNFNASMSFDFLLEDIRRKQIRKNKELEAAGGPNAPGIVPYYNLTESWSGPSADLTLNWKGYSLTNHVIYNTYKKLATEVGFNLGLPAFFATSLSLAYTLNKATSYDAATDTMSVSQTTTRSVVISSALSQQVGTTISYLRKGVENQEEQYETRVGLEYYPKSGCWGLRFLRSKDLNQDEKYAQYVVQLAVIFLGQNRPLDVSPQLQKIAPNDIHQPQ